MTNVRKVDKLEREQQLDASYRGAMVLQYVRLSNSWPPHYFDNRDAVAGSIYIETRPARHR